MSGLSEFLGITVFVSLNKILLFPAYKSTDFEVHRNWLAITNSLPLSDWYYAEHSEWTLDYPPFFAYMEYIFSLFAAMVDKNIVDIFNLNYDTTSVIYFQRMTVVMSDVVFAFAAFKWSKYLNILTVERRKHMLILFIANCGLLIVDHIHFQYNGFLFGILLLSMYYIATGKELLGALYFAALLNFKHIFVYVAPAYGIYLLRYFCIHKNSFCLARFVKLAVSVIFIFALSFVPFIHHLPQVFSRLFPFKRGLTHSYWAPNIWALYNFVDKIASVSGAKFFLWSSNNTSSCFNKGLVQVCEHSVLPSIKPIYTFLLTFLSMLPCLSELFFRPYKSNAANLNRFIRSVQLCSLCSFMFGWHVHEKAIIMSIIPSTLLVFFGNHADKELFFVLQYVGHYSLFPLLYEPFGKILRLLIWVIYSLLSFYISILQGTASTESKKKQSTLTDILLYLYLWVLPLNELFFSLFYPLTPFSTSHPFLPLMSSSVLCSIGLVACFIFSYKQFFQAEADTVKLANLKQQ